MGHLIPVFSKAVKSLFAPGMIGILIFSLILTLVTLTVFFISASSFFIWLASSMDLAWIGLAGTLGSGILAWFLFPGIMPIIVNFFDDRIARTIEREDYPYTAPREPDFWPEVFHDARFSIMAILINLLALPFYLIPIVNIFLFYGLNGYLLGREFFTMAARRHLPIEEVQRLRREHTRSITIAGIALVVLATIPLVNLFAPFWGIAVMIHLFHKFGRPAQLITP